jgi:hypothetical protein
MFHGAGSMVIGKSNGYGGEYCARTIPLELTVIKSGEIPIHLSSPLLYSPTPHTSYNLSTMSGSAQDRAAASGSNGAKSKRKASIAGVIEEDGTESKASKSGACCEYPSRVNIYILTRHSELPETKGKLMFKVRLEHSGTR